MLLQGLWVLMEEVWKSSSTADHSDEPHGSLFACFRIFAPLVDDHVIVAHVTGIARPIPTFADQLR